METLAKAEQREAMESDEREGLVRLYLDTLLPEDWSSSGAVNVVLPGEEGAQCLHLGLPQTGQFADLQNPITLQLLGGGLVLGVAQIEAVGEPLGAGVCGAG